VPIPIPWILALASVYFVMYGSILANTFQQMRLLRSYVRILHPGMAREVTRPMLLKWAMYLLFSLCLVTSFLLEILCRTFHSLTYRSTVSPMRQYPHGGGGLSTFSLLVLYETVNSFLLAVLAVVFYPREISPFFYTVPVHHDQAAEDLEHHHLEDNLTRSGYIYFLQC
jgi:hypothetical protein